MYPFWWRLAWASALGLLGCASLVKGLIMTICDIYNVLHTLEHSLILDHPLPYRATRLCLCPSSLSKTVPNKSPPDSHSLQIKFEFFFNKSVLFLMLIFLFVLHMLKWRIFMILLFHLLRPLDSNSSLVILLQFFFPNWNIIISLTAHIRDSR